ncbi:MAG: GGDEF domain-containing protein [Myxococcaceae bacterium]|nr:GGDEF domain-containing protein [Myxococcaceae bacterium]
MSSSNGDRALDRITALAAILFDAPMSGIVVNGRYASVQGAPIAAPQVTDVSIDHQPMTLAPYAHCRVYVPITRTDGSHLGTLYVADTQARRVSEKQLHGLANLAEMAQTELQVRGVTKAAPHLLFVMDAATRELTWLSDDRIELNLDDDDSICAALETLNHEDARAGLDVQVGHRWLRLGLRVTYCDPAGRPTEITGVLHDITESKATEARLAAQRDQLAQLVTTDELTQVSNKRGLNQRLQLLCAEAERGRRFAVAMVDIDFFKKVNDTHGHSTGDAVLKAVADTLQQSVRKTDFVARFGGEEFCVIFTDVDGPTALALAERLRAAVAGCTTSPVRVTASFGLSMCAGRNVITQVQLLESADQALYRAKRSGRNRVAMARRIMPAGTKSGRAVAA